MKLHLIKAIDNIADNRFKEMLKEGAFPQVKYKDNGMFKSFSLFEYCDIWGKFTKILDEKMKQELDPRLGIFTRKHSATFLEEVKKLADDIVEADIIGQDEHFSTLADYVRGSVMG